MVQLIWLINPNEAFIGNCVEISTFVVKRQYFYAVLPHSKPYLTCNIPVDPDVYSTSSYRYFNSARTRDIIDIESVLYLLLYWNFISCQFTKLVNHPHLCLRKGDNAKITFCCYQPMSFLTTFYFLSRRHSTPHFS